MLYKWYHLWVFGINMKLHQIVVVKHFLMSVTEENRENFQFLFMIIPTYYKIDKASLYIQVFLCYHTLTNTTTLLLSYQGWLKCEDLACGHRTRRVPLQLYRGRPVCPQCSKAALIQEVRSNTLIKFYQGTSFRVIYFCGYYICTFINILYYLIVSLLCCCIFSTQSLCCMISCASSSIYSTSQSGLRQVSYLCSAQ